MNAASLALMAVATLRLAGGAFVDWLTVVLGLGSAAVLLATRVNPMWLILAAAAVGCAFQ